MRECNKTKNKYKICLQIKYNKTFIFTESTLQNIMDIIKCSLPLDNETTLKMINKKLYITYFDVKRRKKIVKKQYKTLHDVFETIKKSSYIPLVTMNELLYCNRYIDGCSPYIFKENRKRKQLFISMLGKDKIKDSVVLKNDKNGFHKIINGILDAYYFFFRGCKGTSMCSYIDNWSFLSKLKYELLNGMSFILCNLLHFYSFHLKTSLSLYSQKYSNSVEVKIVTSFFSILKMLLNAFLEHYCL